MKGTSTGGSTFSLIDLAQHAVRQPIAPSDDLDPYAALPKPFRFQAQERAQQPEDALHLDTRTAPVIAGKGIERQPGDTHVWCAFHHAAHCRYTGTMAGGARQAAPHRPAAIAIHDDCHVQSLVLLKVDRKSPRN